MTEDTPDTPAAKLNQVLTWILEGNSRHAILEAIAGTWPDEDSTPLIIEAFKSIDEEGSRGREQVENWCIAATKFLYAKQVEIGEYGGAMRAIKQIAEFTAGRAGRPIEQPKRIEHQHTHTIELGTINEANIDDHRARLAARIAQISENAGRLQSVGTVDQRMGTEPAGEADRAGSITGTTAAAVPRVDIIDNRPRRGRGRPKRDNVK